MSVDRDDVIAISDLAKFQFSDEEVDTFTPQFQRILHYVEKLQEVNVDGVEATIHVGAAAGAEGVAGRADEVGRSFPAETALENAPDPGAGHFRVPKVI
jgi:aspartyl-tRNA(Asn)/glutamyl-tRNA(Gln) amidotransferase subunit C